ncbi:MAG TPA: NADH-quinone oxidoreductase subunit J, partial [Vicinamibacterales bacterium]|nr:NADH-quinone oxidoreductase subunit J [Vicinamibacterales bacterium]
RGALGPPQATEPGGGAEPHLKMDFVLFYLFGGVAVIASLLVIGQRNPMYSVLLLIVSFGGLAGLYVLLQAPFAAVTQIIVYAGAIMVVFLFVVMLLNVPREEPPPPGLASGAAARRFGVLLALALVAELGWALGRLGPRGMTTDAEAVAAVQSVRAVGRALYTTHAFAFEATSVLILVAMVGAVVLARREPRG